MLTPIEVPWSIEATLCELQGERTDEVDACDSNSLRAADDWDIPESPYLRD